MSNIAGGSLNEVCLKRRFWNVMRLRSDGYLPRAAEVRRNARERDEMPDARLVKSWKITQTLLERARHALPVRREREYTALLTRYHDFMEHNELELALGILEELGRLTAARGGFWRDLERAAENMGLTDRLPAFRAAFAKAPFGPKSR